MYYAPPGQIIVKYIFHKCINVSCLHTVESFIVSGWNKYTAYLRTRMLRDWTVNKCGEKSAGIWLIIMGLMMFPFFNMFHLAKRCVFLHLSFYENGVLHLKCTY